MNTAENDIISLNITKVMLKLKFARKPICQTVQGTNDFTIILGLFWIDIFLVWKYNLSLILLSSAG